MRLIVTVLALFATLALTHPSAAQDDPISTVLRNFETLKQSAEPLLTAPRTPDQELARLRREAEAARTAFIAKSQELAPLLEEIRTKQAALGDPPIEGAPPEAPEVAKQRAELEAREREISGQLKTLELRRVEAVELLNRIAGYKRVRFTSEITAVGPSPFTLPMWTSALVDGRRVVGALFNWFQGAGSRLAAEAGTDYRVGLYLALVLLGGALVGWAIRYVLAKRIERHTQTDPTYLEKVAIAALLAAVRALPSLVGVGALAVGLHLSGVRELIDDTVWSTLLIALFGLILASSLSRAALAENRPAYRIPPITDSTASRVRLLLDVLFTAYALKLASLSILQVFSANADLLAAANLIFVSILAIPVILLALERTWQRKPDNVLPEEGQRSGRWLRYVRYLVLAAAVLMVVAALAGYHNFSAFVAARIVVTGGILAAIVVVRTLIYDLIQRLLIDPDDKAETPPEPSAKIAAVFTTVTADLALSILTLVALLPLWGASGEDLQVWTSQVLTGFDIGNVRISIVDIVVAIATFAVILIVFRLVRRYLAERVLPMTAIDTGVRDSLTTAIGYIGFIVAALAAISIAGLDLSNLAIIAGALSVGIGFGLQNIVNNFVSGLILLIERPIKVGDWVIAGGAQGYVKKINVRATEIETFDRSTVVIPNSELISSPVTNWFFKDRMGRCIVDIGVSYDADVEKVRDTLLACVQNHPRIRRWPAPNVYFMNFGASSLDFSLRFYLTDIDYMLTVGSEIRMEIVKKFREAGIEIPFPQRDLNIREMDRLEAALLGRVSGSGTQTNGPATTPDPGQPVG